MDVDVHGCGQEKGFKMKEIINLQINAFGYEVAGNSGINDTPGYANAHDDEKGGLADADLFSARSPEK